MEKITQEGEEVQGNPSPKGLGEPKTAQKAPVEAWAYTLRADHGGWLAQVVLTSDGMFAAVSDWGNFSYAWRAFGDNFREFLSRIHVDYFGGKMYNGIAYVATSRKIERAAYKFSEMVLPPLQAALKAEALSKAVAP